MSTVVSPSGPWTLGTLIGFPIALLLALAFAVAAYMFFRWARRNPGNYDAGPARWFGIGMVALALGTIAAIASPGGMYPYDSEYHQWRTVTGEVTQVNSRQISDGKAMSQRFVVVIDGQPFGVDDTRASLVKVGDSVTLKCKREWQYAAASGWACNWGGAA